MRMHHRARLIPLVAVALLCPPSAGADAADGWPFGVDGAGPGPAMRGKDLYNLGLLGAKARDPERTPAPRMESGRRRSSPDQAGDLANEGPNRLLVEALLPDGPAATAGLRVGDVIVGIPKAFKEGSLFPLADALVRAESGKSKGVLKLRVEREGEKGTLQIAVAIPPGGKPAGKPTEGEARQRTLDAALTWLAARQERGGGFRETLSGPNGAVVQTSLAGLAWLAGGSDLEQGPHKDNVARAVEFVTATVGVRGGLAGRGEGGPSWDQTNWGYAHAAIFLGELHARTPTDEVRDALVEYGRILAERQEASGGWAHGPGGPNALGYVELNIVSGLALCGIGLAKQAGYDVPSETLTKARDYLVESGGGDGGVAYSTKPGQRGQGNIGRTAGAWLGFVDLGLARAKWTKKMAGYVRSHAGDVFGGHASLMQHFLLAGVAAHAQGGDARKRYWETCSRELTIARAPDGSFQPRPWRESLSIGSNSDVSFGEVWTTAAWAIVLGSEPVKGGRPGLPAWMGLPR
jgi:hypothetical protein